MKLSCSRSALLNACNLVSAAVPSRTTKEILSCIKATAADDTLTLIGFDTEQGVRTSLPVTVQRSESAILPIAQLLDILKNSDDEEITLDTGEDVTKVKCGTSRYELPTRPVDEFPDLPTVTTADRYHEITAGVLRTLIRRTAFAADKKESGGRFALKGILWEASGESAKLIATDTKRLAVCEGVAVVAGGAQSSIVPPKAIALLERSLTEDDAVVRVALRNNDAVFQVGETMIYTTLVQGRFPPYKDIIKSVSGATVSVELPVAAFLACVKRASIMSDAESKRVDMVFGADSVTMTARGVDMGSSDVTMALPTAAPIVDQITIAFDPQHVIEFLSRVDAATVTLEITDGKKPALFKCGETCLNLVMPLGD